MCFFVFVFFQRPPRASSGVSCDSCTPHWSPRLWKTQTSFLGSCCSSRFCTDAPPDWVFLNGVKETVGGAWIRRHLLPPAAPEERRAEIWSPSPRCCCLSQRRAARRRHRQRGGIPDRTASSLQHAHTHSQWNACDSSAFKTKVFCAAAWQSVNPLMA